MMQLSWLIACALCCVAQILCSDSDKVTDQTDNISCSCDPQKMEINAPFQSFS